MIRDGRMKGEQDERSEALLVLVEREDVRLVDFALNVAKEMAPANILKNKVTSELSRLTFLITKNPYSNKSQATPFTPRAKSIHLRQRLP